MSFSDLTKNQKQYFAIGGGIAVVFVVMVFFGIRISLSSLRTAKGELEELTGKIENADRSLARRVQTEEELAKISVKLGDFLENLPPERNYFSWATEVIYSAARVSGLEIDAIDEQSTSAQGKPKGKADNAIKLEAYSLRITARGGFENVKTFLELLEQEQPLARITGVDISTGSGPEIHDVQMFVQWPFNLSAITAAWEDIEAKRKSIEEKSDAKRAKGAKK